MQAIILAAGKGSRLRPLTYKTPKPLLEIEKNKTILDHSLDSLPEKIDKIIIVVNYLKEKIIKKYGHNYQGRKIDYIVHNKLDGSAKALWQCKKIIKKNFLVINGDDLYQKKDLNKLLNFDLAILVQEKIAIPSGGVAKLKSNGFLKEINDYPDQKKQKYLLNTGAYKLNKEIFDYQPILINSQSKEYGLPQTLAKMTENFNIKVVKTTKYYQINNFSDLIKINPNYKKFKKPSKINKETSK
ncbi:MAG: NTP transferase domain-containing protein [Candidatus Moranbacteria bacterium]|nr:NTP transferase domain-containing protein [Candidatus Moranbacteria bacterium]